MPISLSVLDADMGHVVEDMPVTFVFAGQSLQGIVTDLEKSHGIQAGGFLSEFDAQLFARQSIFSTLPSAGVTLSLGGQTYRVAKVVTSPDDVGIRIDLITPDK